MTSKLGITTMHSRLAARWTLGPFLAVIVSAMSSRAPCAEQIPLWEKGAPGFEDRRDEPEQAKEYWVRNIHNPSISVYLPPAEKATGAAVVICPGGGHRELVYKAEGTEAAEYLNNLGVAAFVLKYRLAREANSPYKLDQHAREDGLRAMRLVRHRASEWKVDPKRVGMLGFSAGGEVVAMVAFPSSPSSAKPADGDSGEATAARTKTTDAPASDAIDRLDARPDFLMFVYPGPIGIPETIPRDAPPAFLLVANDDRGAGRNIVNLLNRYREARVPVEAHILAHGGHGFNMGNRSKLASVKGWPQRMADWLADNGILDPSKRPDTDQKKR